MGLAPFGPALSFATGSRIAPCANGFAMTLSITSVSSEPASSDDSSGVVRIYGSDFQSSDTLTFYDADGTPYFDSSKMTYVSSTEIDYYLDNVSDSGTWQVVVNSASGSQSSNTYSFDVGNDGETTVTVDSGTGIIFNNTFYSSCSQAYIDCIIAAENEISDTWSNSFTLNLSFDESSLGSGTYAQNSWYYTDVSYADLVSSLPSSDYLPTSDPNPAGGDDWTIPTAYARMLGLTTSTPTYDALITLNTDYAWDYDQDVIAVIEHEITEGGMGRVGGLGDQNDSWSTMDLFRYDSSGSADYTDGRDGKTTYFSADGGATLSDLYYNNEYNSNGIYLNGSDTADFTGPYQDIFGSVSPGSDVSWSTTDYEIMSLLGWDSTTGSGLVAYYFYWYSPNSGDYYYGTVYDDGSYGYYVGEYVYGPDSTTESGSGDGYYYIYDSFTADNSNYKAGYVSGATFYYDGNTNSYMTVYFSYNHICGYGGLGSEANSAKTPNGKWDNFGNDYYEANNIVLTEYYFKW